jgi:hypothetical protein
VRRWVAQATVGIKPTVDLWSREGSIPFAACHDDTKKNRSLGARVTEIAFTPPSYTTQQYLNGSIL